MNIEISKCAETVEPAIRGGVIGEVILVVALVILASTLIAMVAVKCFGAKEPENYWHW